MEGDAYTIHFVADSRGLVYLAMTNKGYPVRVAFSLLDGESVSLQCFHCSQMDTHYLLIISLLASLFAYFENKEMRGYFINQHEKAVLTANDGSLTRACKSSFKDLLLKYQNPQEFDKVLSIQSKVDVVTSTMQESISVMLQNDERLESLSTATEALHSQAQIFERNSGQLRRKLRWEAIRVRISI